NSGDQTGRNITVSQASVSGLSPATITYDQSALRELDIHAGQGGNTITVRSTPVVTTYLGTGGDNDTVAVEDTGGQLTVDGVGGEATLTIGLNGSVANIFGLVSVVNPDGFTAVTIDDSADTMHHEATLGSFIAADGSPGGLISGLAPAEIHYKYADTRRLTV